MDTIRNLFRRGKKENINIDSQAVTKEKEFAFPLGQKAQEISAQLQQELRQKNLDSESISSLVRGLRILFQEAQKYQSSSKPEEAQFFKDFSSIENFRKRYLPEMTNFEFANLVNYISYENVDAYYHSSILLSESDKVPKGFGLLLKTARGVCFYGRNEEINDAQSRTDEIEKLRNETLIHTSTGVVLDGILKHANRILSSAKLAELGQAIHSGESQSYIDKHTDKPVRNNLSEVYVGSGLADTYGKSFWFGVENLRVGIGISKEFIAKSKGLRPDAIGSVDLSSGMGIGEEVPVTDESIKFIIAPQEMIPRVKQFCEKAKLTKVKIIPLQTYEVWQKLS